MATGAQRRPLEARPAPPEARLARGAPPAWLEPEPRAAGLARPVRVVPPARAAPDRFDGRRPLLETRALSWWRQPNRRALDGADRESDFFRSCGNGRLRNGERKAIALPTLWERDRPLLSAGHPCGSHHDGSGRRDDRRGPRRPGRVHRRLIAFPEEARDWRGAALPGAASELAVHRGHLCLDGAGEAFGVG